MANPSIRCAIYTRKSSDEGLDQSFNSLDAQYEACASYIDSQRHEGWKLIKDRYDDGGISGGTLERPGLARLLNDIDAGRIQMVVVYKIDRLTRSLADFAKLVDRLDAANCSFVSVTQAFNTSSSMGRLTLNVLLSFAQFEREVTAERIRDKIKASKQKGLWMGGVCPLGYDPHPDPQQRTLVINPTEAKTVIRIFELYDQLSCLRQVEAEASREGLRSKQHTFASGRTQGGNPLSRGQIYYLLRNPVYIGEIRHKDQTYPGTHEPIISRELWERVQAKLSQASGRRRGLTNPEQPSAFILTGKLLDETGDRLTPSSTKKGKRQHRYYVSGRLLSGTRDPAGWRISSTSLEPKIASMIKSYLMDATTQMRLFATEDIGRLQQLKTCTIDAIAGSHKSDHAHVLNSIAKVHLSRERVRINLDPVLLSDLMHCDPSEIAPDAVTFEVPWQIKRRGVEGKIIIGSEVPEPDPTLIRLLALAHQDVRRLRDGERLSAIAKQAGVTPAYIRTRSKLAFLSPTIQKAIVAGELDPAFTANRLLAMKIPLDWEKQASLLH